MENIILAVIPVESEGYQAFSELKSDPDGTNFIVSQAALIKKEGNNLVTKDAFTYGETTVDDSMDGTLIGSLIGILGGPWGVLLGACIGGSIGATVDLDEIEKNGSSFEKVAANLPNGSIAIIALADEKDTEPLNARLRKFNAKVERMDAAQVAVEVEEEKKKEKELARKTREEERSRRSQVTKDKVEEMREKISDHFKTLQTKMKI
ncbi:MAG: DUF1269 domain-containing protein [Lachnospiraceae bacterium]|jgi:uncharacterized membrane protein